GFDRMVHLTEENDFIVLEGDEYLSSPIDKRPKFHLYQPNIALLSGIAWDHMNVFPTFENYLQQFQIFVDGIVKGGSITYNQEDKWVAEVIDKTENTIRKFPYSTPDYQIIEGQTYLSTEEGPLPIEVFGKHNLNNLAGAKWICQQMGVDEDDFYQAISTFKGASKRLEKLGESKSSVVFKDFAHSPSKVEATTKASKEQFPEKKLVACLELHTYSSLNEAFLSHYQGTLNVADVSAVFYSPESVAIKKLAPLSAEQIRTAFKNDKLEVFTDPGEFEHFLYQQEIDNTIFLLMSSGNYGGLDLQAFLSHLGIS
ncbi:MAG: peptidoglycan synthetase, partial [Flavobacteriaceae bacterium]|nr:peptidoglycan synthetase [Muriicola sp.]NNL40359.1 peptidoglycan synthetase [Flavobacteriaceae bacterium]